MEEKNMREKLVWIEMLFLIYWPGSNLDGQYLIAVVGANQFLGGKWNERREKTEKQTKAAETGLGKNKYILN